MTYNPLPYFISTVGDKTWLTKTGHPSASVQIGNNADLPIMKRWKSGSSMTDTEQQAVGYYCGLLERQIIDLGNATGFGATTVRDVKGELPVTTPTIRVTVEDMKRLDTIRGRLVELIDQATDASVGVDEASEIAEAIMLTFNLELPNP